MAVRPGPQRSSTRAGKPVRPAADDEVNSALHPRLHEREAVGPALAHSVAFRSTSTVFQPTKTLITGRTDRRRSLVNEQEETFR